MPWMKDGMAYSDSQIRSRHPDTSFPHPIEERHLADERFGYTWQEPIPIEPIPEVPGRVIRDWEFRDRFTDEQLDGIELAANNGDVIAMRLRRKLFTASDGVDLDSPENFQGLQYLAFTYPALGIDPSIIFS